MSDIRCKNASLFILSIAIYLVATGAAEAAPAATSAVPSAGNFSTTPDEVVRKMALQEIGGTATAPAVSLYQSNGNVVMPQVAPTLAAACPANSCPRTTQSAQTQANRVSLATPVSTATRNPLDIVVAGIRNSSTTQTVVTPATNPVVVPSTVATQPPVVAQPVATAVPADRPAVATTVTPTQFIANNPARTSNFLGNIAQLDVGAWGRKIAAKSQSLMLSMRSDSSALLSFGAASLEVSPVLSSRLILSTSASLPEKMDLASLSWQPAAQGKSSALRLLLNDRASSNNQQSLLVLSLVSSHWLSNKPNV
jgi:hypothetical protein